MITKKHYKKIAKTIKTVRECFEYSNEGSFALHTLVIALLPIFRDDNPRFDSERFTKECGLDEER